MSKSSHRHSKSDPKLTRLVFYHLNYRSMVGWVWNDQQSNLLHGQWITRYLSRRRDSNPRCTYVSWLQIKPNRPLWDFGKCGSGGIRTPWVSYVPNLQSGAHPPSEQHSHLILDANHSMDFVSRWPFTACVGADGIEPPRRCFTDTTSTLTILPKTEWHVWFKVKVWLFKLLKPFFRRPNRTRTCT